MKHLHAIVCLSFLAAPLHGAGGELSDLLPEVELESFRVIPVTSNEDALLTISISYKKVLREFPWDGLKAVVWS